MRNKKVSQKDSTWMKHTKPSMGARKENKDKTNVQQGPPEGP